MNAASPQVAGREPGKEPRPMRAIWPSPQPAQSSDAAVLILARDLDVAGRYASQLVQAQIPAAVVQDAGRAVAALVADAGSRVLLVDSDSPESGLALIADIKHQTDLSEGLRVILVSTLPAGECAVAIANAALSAFVVKPVVPAVMAQVVADVQGAAIAAQLQSQRERTLLSSLEQVTRLVERTREINEQLQAVTAQLQKAPKRKVQAEATDAADGSVFDEAVALETLASIERLDDMRRTVLPGQFQSDPSWNMLSELTRTKFLRRKISTTSLCLASKAPMTTALRQLEQLIESGFALRVADPADGRRAFVESTAKCQGAVMAVIGSLQSDQH